MRGRNVRRRRDNSYNKELHEMINEKEYSNLYDQEIEIMANII